MNNTLQNSTITGVPEFKVPLTALVTDKRYCLFYTG